MSKPVKTSLVAVVLAAVWVSTACEQAPDRAATRSPSSSRAARRSRAEAAIQRSVDLGSLLSEIPEYGGRGRNLFAFGSRPVVVPPPRNTPPPPPAITRTAPPVVTSATRVDLKFAGYVETKTLEGETKKYAVLLDGTEILTGAEGDLVANRYKIVQIGLESVTVGVAGSNDTQQIPLRSN